VITQISSADPTITGDDTINAGDGVNYVIGGGGSDSIVTGAGVDTIIGDNGFVIVTAGVRTQMTSTDFSVAGDDAINAGEGDNAVIGSGGNDVITTGAGNDIIIGDQGSVTWSAAGVLEQVASLFDPSATVGNDTINTGDGTNYVIGGGGNDMITGGAGTDYIIGDDGSITLVAGVRNLMTSADFTVAGNDVIVTGDGENYAIGGGGDDIITGGAGRDQLIGDQGFVSWNSDGTRHEVSSLFDTTGTAGADTIHGGGGNDNIIGGLNADDVYGDDGNDIVFGDDGHVLFQNDQEIMAETLDQHTGTGDTIHGGAGNNFLFGGEKNNLFFADPLQDLIVIMDGHVDISADRKVTINIPPFFGDPMLSPLGKSLQHPPAGDGVSQQPIFAVIKTGGETDGLTALFGPGDGQDGASQIISTLSGQPQSAFDLHGLLSGNVLGSSLLHLLAIGPTSLIEAVTVGDVLDSQQDTSTDTTQAGDGPGDHGIVVGALAQGGEGTDVADAPLYPRPTIVEALTKAQPDFASAVEPAAAAMVYDEERGLWIPDVAAGVGPRLILNGADLPMLDLSGEMTMAA
jgi:Ca2+-binding RTX toxin-like protein